MSKPDLSAAIERAIEFRQSWEPDDIIDDESGFSVTDLDVLIAQGVAMREQVAVRVVGDLSELG